MATHVRSSHPPAPGVDAFDLHVLAALRANGPMIEVKLAGPEAEPGRCPEEDA
ncbi:MAG TPA: hypothetical protein VK025_15415 [Steroidobacter sp.]|nr:hypothetical protein [Steroidobacter sp.]